MNESLITRKETARILSIGLNSFDKNLPRFITVYGLRRIQLLPGPKGTRYLHSSLDKMIQQMVDETEGKGGLNQDNQ